MYWLQKSSAGLGNSNGHLGRYQEDQEEVEGDELDKIYLLTN